MLGFFSECIKFFGGMIAGILMLVLLMKFPVIVIGCFVILFLYIRGKACGFWEAAKDIGGFILPFVFWGGSIVWLNLHINDAVHDYFLYFIDLVICVCLWYT